MKRVYDIIIIGAGPAGMMAAIQSASLNRKIALIEHNDRVGKKILSTGNGKCNITNLIMDESCYSSVEGSDFFSVIDSFTPSMLCEFFKEIGLITKEKNGYVYPNSEQASAVLDALRYKVSSMGIDVFISTQLSSFSNNTDFCLKNDNDIFISKKLVIATGGMAAKKLGSDGSGYKIAKNFGHTTTDIYPALVQIKCNGTFFKELHGVRCEANVSLYANGLIASEYGELQLTDYGISGIPVFQLSGRLAELLKNNQKPYVILDFMPKYTPEDVISILEICFNSKVDTVSALAGMLNKKLATVILKECNIKPSQLANTVPRSLYNKLCNKIKNFRVEPIATNGFDNAQTCHGGIRLKDINLNTMESKLTPGLYFAGEIMDVDGKCGGYNLHFAFASGYIAGKAVADSILEK